MTDVLITPGSRKIEFFNSGDSIDATISTDVNGNLSIQNPGGDIAIGDVTGDVYVGDGVNNVNLVFEQDGIIYATTGKTLTIGASGASTAITGSSVSITGTVDFDSAHFDDNKKLYFGTGNDLQIYHDASHSYISEQGTGNLKILTNTLDIKNTSESETFLTATGNGSVDLYYNNSKKFETTTSGATITGQLISNIVELSGGVTYDPSGGGAGTDTATNVAAAISSGNRIAGTYNGYIRTLVGWTQTSTLDIGQSGTSLINHTRIYGGTNGVELYESTDKKLETTPYGVTVTGTMNADSATISGNNLENTQLVVNGKGGSGSYSRVYVYNDSDGAGHPGAIAELRSTGWGNAHLQIGGSYISASSGILNFTTDNRHLRIDPGTANVGIKTTSPSYDLHVNGTLGVEDSATINGITTIYGGSSGYNNWNAASLLRIENNSNVFLEFHTPSANYTGILFTDNTPIAGGIRYAHNSTTENNRMTFLSYAGFDFKTSQANDFTTATTRLFIHDNGNVGIGSSTTPAVSLDISSKTDALGLPKGTTAERPSSPVTGQFRYNTETPGAEIYDGASWGAVGGGGSSFGLLYIYEDANGGLNTDFLDSTQSLNLTNKYEFVTFNETSTAYSIDNNGNLVVTI